MAESIACPHCRRLLQAPADYRGREVRCPECQRVFVGGAPTGITTQAPTATTDVQTRLPPSAGAAPWPTTADDDLDVRKHRASGREFRPGGGLALAVKILLGLNLLLSVAMLGSDYLHRRPASRPR